MQLLTFKIEKYQKEGMRVSYYKCFTLAKGNPLERSCKFDKKSPLGGMRGAFRHTLGAV